MTTESADSPSESGEVAFSRFYRDQAPRLVTMLVWAGARPGDAMDVVQDTMIEAYSRWRDIEHPRAWTRTVALNAWIKHAARRREEPCAQPADAHSLLAPDTAGLLRGDVLEILGSLPERQRHVLALTMDGFSPTEAAEVLDISAENARSNLYKARRAVAARLTLEERL